MRLPAPHRLVALVLGLAVLSLPASVSGAGSPAEARAASVARHPEVAAALRVLDAWIARSVADQDQPGLSIAVVHDQELVWAKGYGFADLAKKTPATPATAYRIASLSKLLTATAILQLRDAGRLQLDDPVSKYFPEFRPPTRYPDAPVITIRHLLTHTSGLPRELSGAYWNDMRFPDTQEMLRELNETGPLIPAETEYKYSNVALSIAGDIVEKVSGEPYARYLDETVIGPLGMRGTRVVPPRDLTSLATGYGRRLQGAPRRIAPFLAANFMTPAASVASTVEDLARFASLQFRSDPPGGAQILKPSTLAEMRRVQWLEPDWKHGAGLGWGVARTDDQVRVSHSGAVPGYRTRISLVPAEKLAVIVLTNADDGRPGRYVSTALSIAGPAIRKAAAPAPSRTLKTDPAALAKYAGRYVWEDDENLVLVSEDQLVIFDPSDDDPWESRVVLEPAGTDTFRMKTGGQAGELVRFSTDASGRVTRMAVPGSYMERQREDVPGTH